MVKEDNLNPIARIPSDKNVAWMRVTVHISINKYHLTIKKAKLVGNLKRKKKYIREIEEKLSLEVNNVVYYTLTFHEQEIKDLLKTKKR